MQDVGGGLSPARQASTTRTDLTMQPVQFKLISKPCVDQDPPCST